MHVANLDISGYRSLRDVHLSFGALTVVTGANGVGKSNLYRALALLHLAAAGRLAESIAEEGGMPSVLWAGPRRRKERRTMSVRVDLDGIEYSMTCGLVPTTPCDPTAFRLDPDVKSEQVRVLVGAKWVEMAWRSGRSAQIRDADGRRVDLAAELQPNASILSQISEPHRFPELFAIREQFLSWRFYHQFRTDSGSPIRRPLVGVRTPVLAHDGRDLGAALQTILEIGDGDLLRERIAEALSGAALVVNHHDGVFEPQLLLPGMQRTMSAKELSDGQLRFLCLCGALMSPRPPTLFALNEPETSIHPDVMPALGSLIRDAAKESQVWVVTHSDRLAKCIGSDSTHIVLKKQEGATVVDTNTEAPF